jgi:putative nucleotidyltransferase with HDIG domain
MKTISTEPGKNAPLTEQLKMLMQIATLINSSLDTRVIRSRAIEAAKSLIHTEEASILLVDPATNELYFDVVAGDSEQVLKEIRIGLDQGVAGWVATNGIPQIVQDVQQDPRFYNRIDDCSQFTTRSLIAAPLQIQGKILGVIEAVNKIDGAFTPEDLELFVSLANLVAAAVENANLHEELRESFYGIVLTLSDALESRDPYTGGHTQRVRDYCLSIANAMNLDKVELETLVLSAMLHDIGKIGVKDAILCKEGPLTKEEADKMSEHAHIGAEILHNIKFLSNVIPAVLAHHERFDGKGYPKQLHGTQIPLLARIIAVADTFDAMTSDRPYRKALSVETAVTELERCSGAQFDPIIVQRFIASLIENHGVNRR